MKTIALIIIILLTLSCQDSRREIECEGVYIEVDTTITWTLYYDDSVDHFIIEKK